MTKKISLAGWEWIAITLILLGTFALTIIDLHGVPPGVIHDEVLNRLNVELIMSGDIRALYPYGGGREALFLFLQTASVTLIGDNLIALRLPSILLNLITVAGIFVLGRRWFGPGVGLFVATAVMGSFWELLMVRLGTRETTLPCLLVLTAYAYDRALEHSESRWAIASGMLLGLSLYTYPAGLIFPAVMVGWVVITVWQRRQNMLPLIASFGVAAVIAIPLMIGWAQPEATTRADAIAGPLDALREGDPRPILSNIGPVAGMFTFQGDVGSEFNNPDQPLLPTLPVALLFYAGLAVTLWKIAHPKDEDFPIYVVLLAWLIALVIPTLVTVRPVAPYRSIGALPAAYFMPAVALKAGWDARHKLGHYVQLGIVLLAFVTLGVQTGHTIHAYFNTWRNNPVVRFLYQDDYRVLAADLDKNLPQEPTAVGGLTPYQMDPTSMLLLMANDEAARELSFFDPQTALLIPDSGQSTIIIPSFVSLHPALSLLMVEQSANPHYALYEPLTLPTNMHDARFGKAVTLWATQIAGGDLSPDQAATLLTTWATHQPIMKDMRIFVHVIDEEGTLIAQSDVLGVPAQNWQEGQIFTQTHELTVPADAPAGPYMIRVGLYDTTSGGRLPLSDGSGDFIILPVP